MLNNKDIHKIIIILSFSITANAQITLTEMFSMLKMNSDNFETYVLKKGYEFSNIKDDDNVFGFTYVKGYEDETKYITLYEKYFEYGKHLTYQTSNKNEYLLIKKQLIELRFKLFESFNFEGSIVKKYKNNIYILTLINGLNSDEETYEISISNNK
jgi:hypothetical protein